MASENGIKKDTGNEVDVTESSPIIDCVLSVTIFVLVICVKKVAFTAVHQCFFWFCFSLQVQKILYMNLYNP